ncbi:hypothetical protein DSM106972_094960 [Dulcicalothrix desertica PCC 7102]|uniref:GmrSD restriction endonucleases N-terminal domain-containing protein n=1 Tax=Dulcicalothrix desertica PCC 7102 TaxID=232991 RepID=A0A3S1CKF4_9CYAN|nr:DUF262 domain-containing protein [Dulcicalothrix desertica]RUS93959.1 hypothetical protein DSM106972_094960 [Dulcicalothrix desertica PCC 7102]TWH62623.1 hypothetical protein CAL7102_00119 [Dulcicalothrix desertica PCC 7102]
MSKTLFKQINYPLSNLIQDIDMGEIGLPDIQRPFVWEAAKVRDLFDSMYRGFPVGYFLFWSNDHLTGLNSSNTRQIGLESKQVKVPRLLIVDGQQRLTSLYSVIKGHYVLTKDFKQVKIQIAFRPTDSTFAVTDAAIQKDPEYIPNISELWSTSTDIFELVDSFLERLRETREVKSEERTKIKKAISDLKGVEHYSFTVMEIASHVEENQVSEIFVRINSKGVTLKQADFILTLLSVFWDEGRRQLEQFCRECRVPSSSSAPSPFNYFIHPDPDQILRVCVGLAFKRARLQYVYSILRGKDLETGEFSDDRRLAQFDELKVAQTKTLDLTNWHEFLKALMQAGFLSGYMITSDIGLLYAYVMFLIGKYQFNIKLSHLRNVTARWFFMTAITGRYSNSPESVMESDLARLRSLKDGKEFISSLDNVIKNTLTEDYWNITLVNELETSSARTPVLFAYYAALNLLGANALFSKLKVQQLLDPAIKSKKSGVERHHLFPKAYLKTLGITEVRQTNQIANYALVEWSENITISDKAPADYFPEYRKLYKDNPAELELLMQWHALPDGWDKMEYGEFLGRRRILIAGVIRKGVEKLFG